jgi:hypothetical protein
MDSRRRSPWGRRRILCACVGGQHEERRGQGVVLLMDTWIRSKISTCGSFYQGVILALACLALAIMGKTEKKNAKCLKQRH